MKMPIVVGSIFCIAGIVLLGAGFDRFNKTRSFVERTEEAEGTIVALKASRHLRAQLNSPTTFYTPVVSFTPKGRLQPIEIAAKSSESSGTVVNGRTKRPFRVGQSVAILYLPDNPTEIKIKSFKGLWLLPSALSGMGIVFIVMGSVARSASKKN